MSPNVSIFFFFNDTATTEIYTLSLHDALPISRHPAQEDRVHVHGFDDCQGNGVRDWHAGLAGPLDRKSTRLNSSHSQISYAVFCLKKKKINRKTRCLPRMMMLSNAYRRNETWC